MKILLSITNLEIGGAQKFVINLASALAADHEVFLYDHRPEDRNHELIKKFLSDKVKLNAYCHSAVGMKIIWKISKILKKSGLNFDFRDYFNKRTYTKLINKENFNVIHSHLSLSDKICCSNISKFNTPIVITLHGCYDKDKSVENDSYVKESLSAINNILPKINSIIYLAEKSLRVFREKAQVLNLSPNFININNALFAKARGGNTPDIDTKVKKLIPLNEGTFVFGMISRGIKEKGWAEALAAFEIVQEKLKSVRVCSAFIAIGGGTFLDELSNQYSENPDIYFLGEVPDPDVFIPLFDVGLLPSYRECYPNVIMEYIQHNKPVIASCVGAIPDMITYESVDCGFLVSVDQNEVPNKFEISDRMFSLATDKLLYENKKSACNLVKTKFSVDACVQQHILLYEQISKK